MPEQDSGSAAGDRLKPDFRMPIVAACNMPAAAAASFRNTRHAKARSSEAARKSSPLEIRQDLREQTMDWYSIVKFLHVVSAILWVGGGFVLFLL
ncbi:MAG: hypothetical protein E5V96_30475, partial [Mesorhizobium sp.]